MRLALLPLLLLASPPAAAGDGPFPLGPPVDCTLGEDCFLQQWPDLDPGPDAVDPFCGTATYDGHKGFDIRVLSMADIATGVSVIAMADGTVTGLRDGEPDRLVRTIAERDTVQGRECGNGVVLDHGGGVVTQYCHLRQGSVAVRTGQRVRRGDKLGEVGASGLAQFPHIHAGLRIDGAEIDPLTGRALTAGCGETVRPLLEPGYADRLGNGDATVLAAGVAGQAVDHGRLAIDGPPAPATGSSEALVGWAWFANLRRGDRVRLRLEGPAGGVLADQTTPPLARNKASYSAFAGRRGRPPPGTYRLRLSVLRDGAVLRQRLTEQRIAPDR